MRKLPYKLGDVFAIPLNDGKGFCLGVVAGVAKGGKVLIGYFYNKIHPTMPDGDTYLAPEPRDAVGIWIFRDLFLSEQRWQIVGQVYDFHPNNWPSPKFLREIIRQFDFTRDASDAGDGKQPNDAGMPAGAIEDILTQIAATESRTFS